MPSQKTLIEWDVGGVLLELTYGDFYKEAGKLTGMTAVEFKQKYIDSNLEFDSLRGIIPFEKQQAMHKKMLGNPNMTREEHEKIATSVWGGELTKIVDIKERAYFKNNGNVLAQIFSNIDQFAWEYLSRTYPRMLQTFRPDIPPICSYLVGDVKPGLAMYKAAQTTAKKFGCDQVILIEDKIKYLEPGIKHFGWHGIHLTINQDPDELIKHSPGHNGNVKPSGKFFVANSPKELEQALKDFGIHI